MGWLRLTYAQLFYVKTTKKPMCILKSTLYNLKTRFIRTLYVKTRFICTLYVKTRFICTLYVKTRFPKDHRCISEFCYNE